MSEIQEMLRFKLKERIAELEFRERRRVTLQEIAEATGLNRMTLSKLANHHGSNVQTDVIDRLCTYFKCKVEELVEHHPEQNVPG
ncbi:helix-turn-helix domain-containing protein [Aquimonas voraii]|uniref:Cro/C1-type HTH DNA-binding domain-containing protein n=1 Tax=Aquimonas voraii TaxID=265719 RepID=A0A1G6Z387_9GAMM|nr:helix-turn-helix transcriptional regulator [Aquimonas voraii]SDD97078.1 Cro/C1-type HTH DNA-binding domain-containing protein [Aquimonas voraii]